MLEASVCWSCVNGLHDDCLAPVEDDNGVLQCCCPKEGAAAKPSGAKPVGRPLSNPDDMKDVLSTGRKRAAMLYPITTGMVCEWAGLRYAGGGVEPIIGCAGNVLRANTRDSDGGDVHHGPNKSVLENSPGNVHRICKFCHHRWHALNDEYYGKERPEAGQPWYPKVDWLPHDSETKATSEEIEENEKYWKRESNEVSKL